jgi:hypothetical protein
MRTSTMSTPQGLAPDGGGTSRLTSLIRLRAGRQQLAHGAAVDLFLEGVAHHAVELRGAGAFIQPHVADVGRGSEMRQRIPVDDHALLLGREQRLGVRAVERQQALVDVATFWNGGGSLKFRPGSVITSLIWPSGRPRRTGAGRPRTAWSRAGQDDEKGNAEESDLVHGMGRENQRKSAGRLRALSRLRPLSWLRESVAGAGVPAGALPDAGALPLAGALGAGLPAACISLSSGRYSRLPPARLHQDLGHVAVDLLHRVDVHAVARDLRRLLVLGQHGRSAAHHPAPAPPRGPCSPGLFLQARGGTHGARHHVVGIGLGLVLGALALLPALSTSSNAACTCSGGRTPPCCMLMPTTSTPTL